MLALPIHCQALLFVSRTCVRTFCVSVFRVFFCTHSFALVKDRNEPLLSFGPPLVLSASAPTRVPNSSARIDPFSYSHDSTWHARAKPSKPLLSLPFRNAHCAGERIAKRRRQAHAPRYSAAHTSSHPRLALILAPAPLLSTLTYLPADLQICFTFSAPSTRQ